MNDRIAQMVEASRRDVVVRQVIAIETEQRREYIPPRRDTERIDPALKVAARLAVRDALVLGVLVRPAQCEMSGVHSKGELQAHHRNGYAPEHWLDVDWLCARHHMLADHGGDRLPKQRKRDKNKES